MRITKRLLLYMACIVSFYNVNAQEWMKSFDVAKKLALTQNKLLFVMWEEATQYELPVFIQNTEGQVIYVRDLLLSEEINTIIWDLFVPVLLNEVAFDDLYNEIKDDRSYGYLQLFRDDSIKIMDVNGNILNTAYVNYNYFDFSRFASKYALDTEFLSQEYRNYKTNRDFYTAFYLGSKYIDFSIYSDEQIRPELLELSNIYLEEAESYLEDLDEDTFNLTVRLELVRLKQDLILNKPRRVIRQLNRIDYDLVSQANQSYIAFLYYTAYKLENDVESILEWKPQVSLVKLKEANYIYKNIKS